MDLFLLIFLFYIIKFYCFIFYFIVLLLFYYFIFYFLFYSFIILLFHFISFYCFIFYILFLFYYCFIIYFIVLLYCFVIYSLILYLIWLFFYCYFSILLLFYDFILWFIRPLCSADCSCPRPPSSFFSISRPPQGISFFSPFPPLLLLPSQISQSKNREPRKSLTYNASFTVVTIQTYNATGKKKETFRNPFFFLHT